MNTIYLHTSNGTLEFEKSDFILFIKSESKNINKQNKELRLGQIVFNILYGYRSTIADQFRGSNVDCFYNDNKIDEFISSFFDAINDKDDSTIA